MKTLILGLGNDILCDDGVGIHIANQIKEILASRAEFRNPHFANRNQILDVKTTTLAGFNLLDLLTGYDRVILIDAIKTNTGKVGEIYQLTPDSFKTTPRLFSFHDIDLPTALELAKRLNIPMPQEIKIFAIQVQDTETLSETCTPEVAAAIPHVINLIFQTVEI
ncbi:MAG: hydrogenase maturation protease [bacterium]|nr:hydrogenase maturation protease [bacterium]